jgi:hypothetical protein
VIELIKGVERLIELMEVIEVGAFLVVEHFMGVGEKLTS